MSDISTLTVDKEFESLCPPLKAEELNLLELSLSNDGCRDPIIVWANHQDTILDGHNRYRYCKRFKVPFKTKALKFDTRGEAINWIIANQLGRRNLSDEQKGYLRGKRYLAEEKGHGGDRKNSESSGHNVHLKTAEKLAAEYNVDEKTIRRDAKFAESIDTLSNTHGEEVRQQILSGDCKLGKVDITKLVDLPVEDQKKILSGKSKMPGKKTPQRPDLPRPKTLSERAKYVKAWVANGEKRDKACSSCNIGLADYKNVMLVVASGNCDLIKAMDDELVSTRVARCVLKTPAQIDKLIEDAIYKREKRNHKQLSIKGKPKSQILLETLGQTYTDWKGIENNLPINSSTIPSDHNKFTEVKRLCKSVRRVINLMLDKIEKEIEKCSAKIAE